VFGPWVREKRLSCNVTLTAAAIATGYSAPHLSAIERGHICPPPLRETTFYAALAELLGDDVTSLVTRARADRYHLVEGTPWHKWRQSA
jgi:hypothetical protein